MFRVFGCLSGAHDWRLVTLAGMVCFATSLVALGLFHRARAGRGRARQAWVAAAGAATGCGIWATHFIAMLAYEPGVVIAFDLPVTMLSLGVATVATCVGMGIAIRSGPRIAPILGGALVGAGIAGMHYLGIWALEVPGQVAWSLDLVAVSIALGIMFGMAALAVATRREDLGGTLLAAGLLTLAIVSHHFTAMGAIEIVPDPLKSVGGLSTAPVLLALLVAGVTLAVLTVGAIGAIVDQHLSQKNAQFAAALEHMGQGLVMFDAHGRLALCNRRYIELAGLSAGDVKPGLTLGELLRLRLAAGTFQGDPDRFIVLKDAQANDKSLMELPDGRTIAVSFQAMVGGGWVSTHDDITEARRTADELRRARAEAERAECEARSAHSRLVDALEAVPEGLALFDSDDRFVLVNKRYAEFHDMSLGEIAPGVRFEDALRVGLARRPIVEAVGREEAWLEARLAQHNKPQATHEEKLSDGRWMRIEERRTADGGRIGIRVDITDLKRREESFRLLFDGNPVPMWVFDRQTLRFLAVNAAALEHYGYSREQFLTMSLLDIRPTEDRDAVQDLAEAPKDRYSADRTWRHTKANGAVIEVAVYSRTLRYGEREARLVAAIDVTERRRAEDELRRTRTFLDMVVENVPATIIVKDARDLKYVLINRAGESLYNVTRDDFLGKTAYEVFPKVTADMITEHDQMLLQTGSRQFHGEHPMEMPGRQTRVVTAATLPILDDQGKPQYLLSVVEDMTERKNAESRIAHMAYHDSLTDLPNRTAFNECFATTLARAVQTGESYAVLCLDLDRFKEVNDVFGHAVGDLLLCEVSRRLREAAGNAYLSRLGGDEFALIATGEGLADTQRLAERLQGMVADPMMIGGVELRTALSIGIAIFPADGRDPTSLLANADAALGRAKAEGRGAVRFFDADTDQRLRERRALQQDLGSAIDRNEFVLHYQPQVRIDGEMIGFEALVRWNHPFHGWVSPATFIPLADESGLIVALGAWILREACREAASWPRPLSIAVNLSPVQFGQDDLVSLVHSVLLEAALDPSRLELEITESVMIDDFPRAMSILRRLKSLGVRIAMDDFGTGYSSLSYLQSFPFDKIKIDRSFISQLETNPQSAAIVRAVIGLARGLGVPVLAEGVETQGQVACLAREGCDEMQGYLLGRPLPIEDQAERVGRATPAGRLRRLA